MWALPRMEEVPVLTCPLHPIKEKDEEGVARALTPTKAIPVSSAPQNPEGLVLPGNQGNLAILIDTMFPCFECQSSRFFSLITTTKFIYMHICMHNSRLINRLILEKCLKGRTIK